MVRVISNPLKEAVVAMDDIAQGEGDLTRQLHEQGRDEISSLGAGFNQFVEKIRIILKEVSSTTDNLSSSARQMTEMTEDTSTTIQKQRLETSPLLP